MHLSRLANNDVVYKLHNSVHSTPRSMHVEHPRYPDISGEDSWNLWANLRLDFVIL